jgi:predicted transcriptional regulator
MRLEEYLTETGLTRAEFARQIGVSQFSITRYIEGRAPKTSVMCKIIEATEGKVSANDFFGMAA